MRGVAVHIQAGGRHAAALWMSPPDLCVDEVPGDGDLSSHSAATESSAAPRAISGASPLTDCGSRWKSNRLLPQVRRVAKKTLCSRRFDRFGVSAFTTSAVPVNRTHWSLPVVDIAAVDIRGNC